MKKLGTQTIKFDNPPTILECASIVGPKEADGPLAKYFDQTLEEELWGEKTWEKAESKIIKETVNTLISKSGIPLKQIEYCFAKLQILKQYSNILYTILCEFAN